MALRQIGVDSKTVEFDALNGRSLLQVLGPRMPSAKAVAWKKVFVYLTGDI
jgi:hypothetical protein